jgi:hypothetical protein
MKKARQLRAACSVLPAGEQKKYCPNHHPHHPRSTSRLEECIIATRISTVSDILITSLKAYD